MGRQALLVAASDLQTHKAPFANECQLHFFGRTATDVVAALSGTQSAGVPSAAFALYDAPHKV